MSAAPIANLVLPKEPRWISTDAGRWAWQADTAWRSSANRALSVQERSQLLRDAEELWQSQQQTA